MQINQDYKNATSLEWNFYVFPINMDMQLLVLKTVKILYFK